MNSTLRFTENETPEFFSGLGVEVYDGNERVCLARYAYENNDVYDSFNETRTEEINCTKLDRTATLHEESGKWTLDYMSPIKGGLYKTYATNIKRRIVEL